MHVHLKVILSVASAWVAVLTLAAYEVTPKTKIVIPDMDKTGVGSALKAAARELSLDIEEATGWKISVVEAAKAGDTAGAILIGEKFAADEGLVPPDLKFFDNVIAEKGGRLYLFGHDRPCRKSKEKRSWIECIMASVKAVTDFEYRFMGVKRILPGRTGAEIPKRDRISVPDGFRRVSRPIMENGTGRYFDMMYSIANNIFGCGTYRTYGGHTYHRAIPDGKYFKTHPEYFAMKNGKRVLGSEEGYSELCISNPEVRKLLVSHIVSEFDAGADVVELGQQDSGGYCECENCRAYGGPEAKTVGEKYWIFHRSIAEELYKLRPGKTVQITSYRQTDCTPSSFREFPPNVMVELMTYSDEVFAAWSKYVVPRGFSVYVYMWGDYQGPGLTCKTSTRLFARLARRFVKNNVHSIYRCGYGELFGTEGPATYVFNRLLADPDQDEDALFVEYLEAAYGPAAEHMRKFHRAFDERVAAWAACYNRDRKWPWPRQSGKDTMNAIYTPEMLNLCESSLAAAEATPGLSDKAKRRLELVRREFSYAKLTAEACMLLDAYKIAPSVALFEDIASRVAERNALIDSFFGGKERVRQIDGWPEYHPFSNSGKRSIVTNNGRLFASIHEPFNWNFDKMRKMLAKGGNARRSAKVVARGKGGVWHDVGGMTLGPCAYKTKFRCSYDDRNLYVEVDAELPDSMTFAAKGHDANACFRQECLELFIDPLFQKTRNYHFAWNPVGDSYYEEAFGLATDPLDPEADKYKMDWDGRWNYITKRKNGHWHSLVTVPFSTLGVAKPLPGTKWYLNLGRETFRESEQGEPQRQLWNPSLSGHGMRDLDAMGIIEFE